MNFFAPFTLPFIVGAVVMFIIIIAKYSVWFYRLPKSDKQLALKGLLSIKSITAIGEVISESLLHRRIFKRNPLLGYMHMSLAFGWFLLIATGWLETLSVLGFEFVPLQGHVFFKYFSAEYGLSENHLFAFLMDLFLAVVLSGVLLALSKRFYSRMMGMRKATKHILGDRVALSALWFVFPARLVAESLTCSIYGGGGFLTGTLGRWLAGVATPEFMNCAWWFYSCCLGIFFLALPFSRYMHIFTEIPLIFLRHYGLKPSSKGSSYDNFELEACSRCGICIDPCQLQSVLQVDDVQSVYFMRDRRYKMLELSKANNCLMCGRCQAACPVGINLDTLRLNSREAKSNVDSDKRFDYISSVDCSQGKGKVGYFAGCMTMLTPSTMSSMETIFNTVGEDVWWADRNGGVCCGRPLHLSGQVDAARKMMDYNRDLFEKHSITTLVTSCPICLRVFKEEYDLKGIEVLHHTEYIDRLIRLGRLTLNSSSTNFTYHDPCELGRGCGVYDAPRRVIQSLGVLKEAKHNRESSLCCGSSLANTVINDAQQVKIASALTDELAASGADTIITSCPLCKKAMVRTSQIPIEDISEVVAKAIVPYSSKI
ncbi:MAG: (Fe-S)-binding protein [Rikenellaceae bacterium]